MWLSRYHCARRKHFKDSRLRSCTPTRIPFASLRRSSLDCFQWQFFATLRNACTDPDHMSPASLPPTAEVPRFARAPSSVNRDSSSVSQTQ
jgi:hypothetical protein